MKFHHFLPLAAVTLLIGCSTHPAESDLNDTLPKLTLQQVLPAATANEFCNSTLDSDIAYGVGYNLYNEDKLQEAKSCLIMAAPKHNRAFCYLSMIAEQEHSRNTIDRNTEALNYLAYSASRNDWCAEYGMYQNFTEGRRGATQDQALGERWLERSAKHGYPDAQQTLAMHYTSKGDLASSYAWVKIMNIGDDASSAESMKERMTPEQIAQGDKLYAELSKVVTSKQALYEEARVEEAVIFAADIYTESPDTFKGMSPEARQTFVKKAIATARERELFKKRGAVSNYVIVAWHAQQQYPSVDIAQNKQIVTVLNNLDLSADETVTQSLAILKKTYK